MIVDVFIYYFRFCKYTTKNTGEYSDVTNSRVLLRLMTDIMHMHWQVVLFCSNKNSGSKKKDNEEEKK